MIQLADDIDISVAVSAIGLIKQLLRCVSKVFLLFLYHYESYLLFFAIAFLD
jgi:hypothetical protein